nr:type I methionyl aminopeptidase [uncultured Cellulosilyticum sp.]
MNEREIEEQLKWFKKQGYIVPNKNLLKSKVEIEGIRESGKINIAVLDEVVKAAKVGMSTEDIDQIVYQKTKEFGGIPGTLGYSGFPKSCCTSINSQICHGIPSKADILKEGDIVNVDITTIYNGFFSDSSRMICIGEIEPETKRLVEVAKESIQVGLKEVKPWHCLGNMGQAIHDYVRSQGFSVVREIGGHGVGKKMHEEPFVSYVSKRGTEMMMVPGMVFTIEPMINMGTSRVREDYKNGWTIYTKDGKPSAQWEVTVVITESSYEILAY